MLGKSLELMVIITHKRDSSSRDNLVSGLMVIMDPENNSIDDLNTLYLTTLLYSILFIFLLVFI